MRAFLVEFDTATSPLVERNHSGSETVIDNISQRFDDAEPKRQQRTDLAGQRFLAQGLPQ